MLVTHRLLPQRLLGCDSSDLIQPAALQIRWITPRSAHISPWLQKELTVTSWESDVCTESGGSQSGVFTIFCHLSYSVCGPAVGNNLWTIKKSWSCRRNSVLQVKVCVSEPPLRLYIKIVWKQDVNWSLVLHWSAELPGPKLAVLMQESIKLCLPVWLNLAF